jgi:WD40 repeat protein/serine/threonine protein kinase
MKRCPDQVQLQDFLEERGDDRETIASHVGQCPRCQEMLEELTSGEELPAAGTPPALDGSQAAFLSKLKQMPPGSSPSLVSRPRASNGKPAAVPFPALQNYEILGELGRGGMGVVYKARQVGLNRFVALKMILAGHHAALRDLARFRREAEAVARLHHPNIVQIFDIGESEGRPFYAMEYIEGGSLAKKLRGDPQPLDASTHLIETLARAIHFAHERHVVHRDLKPANILLQGDERAIHEAAPGTMPDSNPSSSAGHDRLPVTPKITDFGLAKRLDTEGAATQSGEIVGTPSYMAPEQAAKSPEVGPAADVYALGAILYEMITGRPPFCGATSLETVLQVLHEEPVRPSVLRRGLPRDLETICLKCLAKEPARRYGSAAALADDLQRFRRGRPILARPVSVPERIWKWARKRPVSAALVAGIFLMAFLGFAGITWQWQEARLARDDMEIERAQAEEARIDAEEARRMEVEQRRKVRVSLYFSRLAQSQLQWRVNDAASAAQTLAKCRPARGQEDNRGWEWNYLKGLFHTALFTLSHGDGGMGGCAAFSPDGRWIASVVGGQPADQTPHSAEVRIWDASNGNLLHALPIAAPLHRLVFQPDGKRLALASTDGSLLILDPATGREIVHTMSHDQSIAALAYSPDGKLLASAGWDATVKIRDAATGKIQHELRGHSDRIQSLDFHPDGTLLATGSWDATVKLWDLRTRQVVKTLQGHKHAVFCVAFSSNGKNLVSAGSNGNLKIWELAGGRVIQNLTADAGAVLDIDFSPDGRYLAKAGKDGTVRIWDLESGVERITFRGHTSPVESVHFSPDCRRLVSVSPAEGTVKVWDLTRHPEYATFARSDADLESIAFEEHGERLVSVTMGGKLQIWDVASSMVLDERQLPLHKKIISPSVTATFSPGGKRLAGRALEDPRIVKLWNVADGSEIVAFRGHDLQVLGIRFSNDGSLLATWSCDSAAAGQPRELIVWDAGTGRKLQALDGKGRIMHAAFSADNQWLAWGESDGHFVLADWRAGTIAFRLAGHKNDVVGIAFSPDGQLLATAGLEDRALKIWKLSRLLQGSEKPRLSLAAPNDFGELVFSSDSRRLAGISRDMVKMWEVETGQEVLTLRGAPQRYWDPPFNPRLAFSPDGTLLAGTNWNESISIWEAPPLFDKESFKNYQAGRRRRADLRGHFWHLQEAEHCLEHKNLPAARFHLQRVTAPSLPPPLQLRKERLLEALKAKKGWSHSSASQSD